MDNVTGRCYPSILTIAEECRLTDRTVRTALNKLVALGLISRHREKYKNASFSHYVYFPRIPGETISANNEKQVEIKTSNLETNLPNQRKSLPPNYPENYLYNYDNKINKVNKNEKYTSIRNLDGELIIYESEVKTKNELCQKLMQIKNFYKQEELLDWVFDNDLSEVKSRDELKLRQ